MLDPYAKEGVSHIAENDVVRFAIYVALLKRDILGDTETLAKIIDEKIAQGKTSLLCAVVSKRAEMVKGVGKCP